MLENPPFDPSAAATVPAFKRYAPPNQRNRSLGRRKSGGEVLERANNYGNGVDAVSAGNHVDLGKSRRHEIYHGGLIPFGCCHSEAFQLLNDRWAAANNAYAFLPEDSSERPTLYSKRSASPWGNNMLPLPHMLMKPAANASSGSQRDFLSELRNAIRNSPGNSNAKHL